MLKKTAQRTTKIQNTSTTLPAENNAPPQQPLDEAAVAELAYQRWVERGCPQGSAEEDWLEAERRLRTAHMAVSAGG